MRTAIASPTLQPAPSVRTASTSSSRSRAGFRSDPDGPRLKTASPIPIYVDEDCHRLADVAACAERAHGINIKLAKSGGIPIGPRRSAPEDRVADSDLRR